jgi:23S rRNA (guanosine2251-2'-O)-methyltransferase
MIISGKNSIAEALRAGANIEKIIVDNEKVKVYSALIAEARGKGVKVSFAAAPALAKESGDKNNRGIIARLGEYAYIDLFEKIRKIRKEGSPLFILILDGIEDPHNLGAILRVAESAGVQAIVIGKDRACPINATVIKTSAGAASFVDVAKVTNINQTIRALKEDNVFVYGADMDGEDIYGTDLKGDIAIVIGSEGKGLHELTAKLCDKLIALPQMGKINSLNASVAAGAVLYEAVRQRRTK